MEHERRTVVEGWAKAALVETNSYARTMCKPTHGEHTSRVSEKNGVSLLYIMLETHHSGREALMYSCTINQLTRTWNSRRQNPPTQTQYTNTRRKCVQAFAPSLRFGGVVVRLLPREGEI